MRGKAPRCCVPIRNPGGYSFGEPIHRGDDHERSQDEAQQEQTELQEERRDEQTKRQHAPDAGRVPALGGWHVTTP